MIQRCNNSKNPAYANYGGRGIAVCQKWLTFVNFLADMGENATYKTLDRIDNNKGYCKSNCKWLTTKQQSRNRRDNLIITHNAKTQCLADWAEEVGINRETLKYRLDRGWSIQKAFERPVIKYRKS